MKRILSIALLFVFVLSAFNYAETKDFKNYKLGCKPAEQKMLSNFKKLDKSKLKSQKYPAAFDLTNEMPPIGDQGQQGSCVAWATGYANKSYAEGINQGWNLNSATHQMSPAFIYNQINGGVDQGAYITDALFLLMDSGCCTLNKMPYDENDFTTQPSQDAIDQAAHYKNLNAYYNVTPGDIEVMKGMMNDFNAPLVIGIPVDDDFYYLDENNDTYDVCDSSYGGHAIALVGYSDTKNAFKIQNSWGTAWGIDGYGWLSYDLVEANFNGLYDAYSFVQEDEDEIYPESSTSKKITFESASVKVNGVGRQWSTNVKLYNENMTKYLTMTEGKSRVSKKRVIRIKCREDDGKTGDDIAIKVSNLQDGVNNIKVEVPESSNPSKVAVWTFKIVVDDNYTPTTHKITQKSFKVIKKNHVGKQWKFYSKISNKYLKNNISYTTSAKTVYLKAVEKDKGKDDIGKWVGTLKPGTNTITFTVKENEGKYKGYKATVQAVIKMQ